LTGEIKLGLSNEILLDKIPGFFKQGDAASAWTEVKVGGLASAPNEDLSPKLQAWLAEQGVKQPEDLPEDGGEAPGDGAGTKRAKPRADTPPASREEQLKELYDDLLKDQQPSPVER
jgi:hypothetical protein